MPLIVAVGGEGASEQGGDVQFVPMGTGTLAISPREMRGETAIVDS